MDYKKFLTLPLVTTLLFVNSGVASADSHHEMDELNIQTEAIELRTSLDHLLTEHAFLAIEVMKKGADGSEDFESSVNALNANTEELSSAIAGVYGEDAGNSFNEMWTNHIGFFVDYVVAVTEEDEAGKEEALEALGKYREDFSQFLETATEERLEAEALAEGLQMHVDQLVGAFDAYVMGDYETSYNYEREAIHHMLMVSKGLSTAITEQFPEEFNHTQAVTPASDLRSELNYLFTEHAGFAVIAMQNGIDGAEDFEASAMALDQNTEDLTAAVEDVYGPEGAEQFNTLWSDHIGYFVDYVNATAEEDEAGKEEALENLADYQDEFSTFMDTATEGNFAKDDLAEGLGMHVDQLINAFEAYNSGDYATAYDLTREAYHHMLGPAEGLTNAIVMQYPEMFESNMPDEMPDTAVNNDNNYSLIILIMAGIVAAGAIVITQKRRNQKVK